MDKYNEQAKTLAIAIDIAIKAFQTYPPYGSNQSQVDHMVNTYLQFKNEALNPKPQYKNLGSLKYSIEAVFTFFQECAGKAVDYFWEEIKKNNLPYKRENKLVKILKRGKIKDSIEYDFIIDVIVPYQQEGLLTADERNNLNQMISVFENKKKA